MSEARLAAGRTAAVAVFVVLALASTLTTYGDSWSFLSGQRESYADLTASEPNVVPDFQSLIPVEAANFFFAHLHRGERYYLLVREGTFFTGVDLPTAVRTFGRFALLPAVAVQDPREADVVLAVDADPATLGLRYASVDRAAGGRYAVARVAGLSEARP